ncbi:hypothetical protein AJ87_41490 [Rhizobium yanglingense]|nr:hypothetical protein AJ87_41490 [Rhizobium yanglingense]
MAARDGQWLMAAGLVLVRQRPGSAKGVMFITIEDETGVANVVVWPKLFERSRRVVLGASMMATMAGSSGKGMWFTWSPSSSSISRPICRALPSATKHSGRRPAAATSSPMALPEVRIPASDRRRGFGQEICSCRIFISTR